MLTMTYAVFVKKDKETYLHLFLNCEKVREIWQYIVNTFDLVEIKDMKWQDIFLGLSGNSNRIKSVNSIILWVKQMILRSRVDEYLPSHIKIKQMIVDYIEEEKRIAKGRGKISLHLAKWEGLGMDGG